MGIFFPNNMNKSKLILGLNENIANILEQCGGIKPGDLIQIKHQKYSTKMTDDIEDKKVYNLNFADKEEIPSDLEMYFISNPLDLHNGRQSIFIKDGKQQNANKTLDTVILCEYDLFNDHIDYHNFNQNKKNKNNKKRRAPPPKKKKKKKKKS